MGALGSEVGVSDPPGAVEAGLGGDAEGNSAQRCAAAGPPAPLLSAAASSDPQSQRRLPGSSPEQERPAGDKAESPEEQQQDALNAPHDPKEDTSCPTCSSSSDSEPEGFFLGQQLPQFWRTPGSLPAGDRDTTRKNCTIC